MSRSIDARVSEKLSEPYGIALTVVVSAVYVAFVAHLFGFGVEQILSVVQPTGFIGLVAGLAYTLARQVQETKRYEEQRKRSLEVERREFTLRAYELMKNDLEDLTREIALNLGSLSHKKNAHYSEMFADGFRTAYVPLLTAKKGQRISVLYQALIKAVQLGKETKKGRWAREERLKRLQQRFATYTVMFGRLYEFAEGDSVLRDLIDHLPLGRVHSAILQAQAATTSAPLPSPMVLLEPQSSA